MVVRSVGAIEVENFLFQDEFHTGNVVNILVSVRLC